MWNHQDQNLTWLARCFSFCKCWRNWHFHYLQILRTYTGVEWDIKILGKLSERGPKISPLWNVAVVVKFVLHFNLRTTKFNSIIHIRKEQKFAKFCSRTLQSNLCHIFPSSLYFEKHDLLQSFFQCGSRVVHYLFNWPMVQSFQRRVAVSLKKRGPRQLPRYPSIIFIPELAICLVGKAHVTKMN